LLPSSVATLQVRQPRGTRNDRLANAFTSTRTTRRTLVGRAALGIGVVGASGFTLTEAVAQDTATPSTSHSAAYFRVTGPTVVIEYSPQQMGGDAANQIHGIYRDPTNDYGASFAS
jgi:hypothetical protein